MSTAAVIASSSSPSSSLGALVFFSFARRDDVRGAGALSGETRSRDRAHAKSRDDEAAADRAHRRRRRGRGHRSPRHDARQGRGDPADHPVGPAGPRGDRRVPPPVLQPRDGHADERRHRRLLRGRVRRVPVADRTGGFGGTVTVGKLGAIKDGIKQGNGFFYAPEAKSWITEYPAEALPAAETVYPENLLVAMREGIIGAQPEVPAPRLPRARVHDEPVVRVPVPRLAVQPRR